MRHAPILIAILFFIPCAHAGERIEFYSKHINVVSSNESVEVGDEPGHVLAFFAGGSYYFEKWSGEVKDGRAVGTADYHGGSGRFEGMTGGSKYDCTSLGDRFICDVRGVIELP